MLRIPHSAKLHYSQCIVHGGGSAYFSHRNSRQMISNMEPHVAGREAGIQRMCAQVIDPYQISSNDIDIILGYRQAASHAHY